MDKIYDVLSKYVYDNEGDNFNKLTQAIESHIKDEKRKLLLSIGKEINDNFFKSYSGIINDKLKDLEE